MTRVILMNTSVADDGTKAICAIRSSGTKPPLTRFGLVLLFLVLSWPRVSAGCQSDAPITDVAFSPDGRAVLACSQSGLQVLAWPTLHFEKQFAVGVENIHCVRFSTDGTAVAIAGGTPGELGMIQVFAWPEMLPLSSTVMADDSLTSVQWIDNQKLVASSLDGRVLLWAGQTAGEVQSLRGHSKAVTAVCVLKGGKTIVTAGYDQSLRVWDLDSQEVVRSLNQHTKAVTGLALNPSSAGLPVLASISIDHTVRFWQPTIGRMVRSIKMDSVPTRIAWLDGNHVAVCCADGTVLKVNFETLQTLESPDALVGWAHSLAVHPLGQGLVVAGENGQIRSVKLNDLTDSDSMDD